MTRQRTFLPSLVASALLNLALFAVLQPVRMKPGDLRHGKFVLHRLQRVQVAPLTPVLTTPVPPAVTATVPPATPTRVAAAAPVAVRARPTPSSARRAGGGRAASPAVASRGQVAPRITRPFGATGGDGTQAAPTIAYAGGGDPITARPSEAGDPTFASLAPALAGLTRPPLRGGLIGRDGPPLIYPGPGLRGGTPTGAVLGLDPLPGTAGSGSRPDGLAPRTLAGWDAPLAPTTPGPRLRTKAGPGLPTMADSPVEITAMPVDPTGRSGGGGGTATVPGVGGGGPALSPAAAERIRGDGGGGSGLRTAGLRPGGVALGTGPGGTGGGGNGLAPLGAGIVDGGGGLQPAAVHGAPSVVRNPGHGDGDGPSVRPGKRAPGPGGAPAALAPEPGHGAPGAGGQGGSGGRGDGGPGSGDGHGRGNGAGRGHGQGDGDGDGGTAAAVGHRRGGGSGATSLVIDTLGLTWPHYPTSFDLRVGSVTGPLLASVGVVRYPSVAAARASTRALRDGRREVIVIEPLAIEYVAKAGEGARQRVVISAADAALIRQSGLLREPSRILTVYKNNF